MNDLEVESAQQKSVLCSTKVSNIRGRVGAEIVKTERIGITEYAASRIKTSKEAIVGRARL